MLFSRRLRAWTVCLCSLKNKRCLHFSGLPRRCRSRRANLAVCLVLTISLLSFVHFRLMPTTMGYYNENCHMQEAKREQMRFLLRETINFLNSENATYWLDFGTLLGAIREGDVMSHDGDVDISRLTDDLGTDGKMMARYADEMKKVGVTGNGMIATYKEARMDLFRYQTRNSSAEPLLHKYYPSWVKSNFMERVGDYLFPPTLSPRILFPLRSILVLGVRANIPRLPLEFLQKRYPLTGFVHTFPYKWKCWAGKS